jgi:hypothetical protein
VGRPAAAPATDVMTQEALAHRVHLVGHLGQAKVARPDGPALHDGRQPGLPVASVQETSIRASASKDVEGNVGLHPRLSWKKSPNLSNI